MTNNDHLMKCYDTIPSPIPNDSVNKLPSTPPIVQTTTDLRIKLISKFNKANSTTEPSSLTPSFIESARLLVLYYNDMRSFRLGIVQSYFITCEDLILNSPRLSCHTFSINKYIYRKVKKIQSCQLETTSIKRKLNRMVESPSRY